MEEDFFDDEELLEQQLLEEQLLEEQRTTQEQRVNIQERRNVKREQDIAFLESLYSDQMKDLLAEREKQRQLITDLLRTKLPTTVLELIPQAEQRLLRIREIYLTPEEREFVQALKEEIARLEAGGCYEVEEGPGIFKIRVPGVALALCFDIEDILEQGLVNEDLTIADVNIALDETGELYRYPLSEEETKSLLSQIRSLGLNIGVYPKLSFPNIEETRNKLYDAYAE